MPFNRPSMSDLVERIASDFESRLPGTDARLRRSNVGVIARVMAACAHGLYGFLNWIARQVIIDTAEGEVLERWAAVWGITRRGASAATGRVRFSGAVSAVVVIPAGTVLQRADGMEFVTTAAVTLTGGTAVAPVVARIAGADGNTAGASRLTLAASIVGVGAEVVVEPEGLAGGSDVESDESLLDRLLFRIRKPPQGGAAHDYEAWAREVAGVTRVWVYPLWMGVGTVGVFFVRDGDDDPIPSAAEVAAVQAHIETRRPVTAEVYVLAPTPRPVDVRLRVSPDTPNVRAAVEAELRDLFRREAQPGGTLLRSHITEAISLASGEFDHVLEAPTGDVAAQAGEMPVLGSITWL